jgi:chromosome segregation ATPase
MARLTTIFKAEPEVQPENDKLVDLFKNRAELKKEFAALRDEKYRLQDRVKQHEGAIARVQQKLNHIESLLLDPEWVHNVVAYYQLRRLGLHCQSRLARFAEELKQQREQRIYGKILDRWNAERKVESDRVKESLHEHRAAMQLLEDRLQVERHKLSTMNGVSRMLNGRTQAALIDDLCAQIEGGNEREQQLLADLKSIEDLEPPPQQGLDIAAKRSINFMILSFAQQLYLCYAEDDLAELAKEAMEKSLGAINYGSKEDSDELLDRLARRKDEVEQQGDFAEVLAQRAKKLAEGAVFRGDDDAVPVSGSVAIVFDIDPNGVIRQKDVNLLGENYFGVSKVLSR